MSYLGVFLICQQANKGTELHKINFYNKTKKIPFLFLYLPQVQLGLNLVRILPNRLRLRPEALPPSARSSRRNNMIRLTGHVRAHVATSPKSDG